MTTEQLALASFWIAGASAIVAGVALGWQVFTALRVDRAHLRVDVANLSIWGDAPEECVFVTATNTGRRPTRLLSLHLALGRRWRIARLLPRALRPKTSLVINSDKLEYCTSLPVMLDVGQDATLCLSESLVRQAMARGGKKSIYGMAGASTVGVTVSRPLKLERTSS